MPHSGGTLGIPAEHEEYHQDEHDQLEAAQNQAQGAVFRYEREIGQESGGHPEDKEKLIDMPVLDEAEQEACGQQNSEHQMDCEIHGGAPFL